MNETEGTIEIKDMRFEPDTIASGQKCLPPIPNTSSVSCSSSHCGKALWPYKSIGQFLDVCGRGTGV